MRLTQIDTAKFLAVFFVIISHCCMHNILGEFLFSFHVQLFFIAFGYVFKQKCNYSAPPMGMSNRLTVVLQQELH